MKGLLFIISTLMLIVCGCSKENPIKQNTEKANLAVFDSTMTYTKSVLISETVEERHLLNAQSQAAFGNYLFEFGDNTNEADGNDVAIYNLKTGAFISKSTLGINESSHNNNAVFTKIFYTSSDTYPILLVSRWERGGDVYAFRLSESDTTTIAFTLIQRISFNIVEKAFGLCVAYDAAKNEIVTFTHTKGSWNSSVTGNQTQ